eukprot:6207935-Pleurochrysis_carterae.AAC.2
MSCNHWTLARGRLLRWRKRWRSLRTRSIGDLAPVCSEGVFFSRAGHSQKSDPVELGKWLLMRPDARAKGTFSTTTYKVLV